jgi:hypothetical protein
VHALVVLSTAGASAFPGVVVAKDDAVRTLPATEIVVLRHAGFSVVTVAARYAGPLSPFALLLPVPADVVASEVRTVKRGILARVEEVSAPRFHVFFEQNPCVSGAPEQSWEEHVRAQGPGFLTPADVPPADARYGVSNAIGVAVEPVFKQRENEFRYQLLTPADEAALRARLAESGYRLSDGALRSLAPHLGRGRALLLAEVDPAHVELVAPNRADLGGIRWVSKATPSALPVTLGLAHSPGVQELTVYALDRRSRTRVDGYETALLPSNVAVHAGAALQVGALYNALFDTFSARHPAAFVTEYAWSTAGCGQPCPDAPLAPDELLTLGGDVLEARTTTAKERAPAPPPETERERAAFEAELRERPAAQRAKARSERAVARRELERRRALMARQTYVLTRLHRRYDRAGLPRDVTLVPATPAVSHGVGVPKGPSHSFVPPSTPSKDEVQVRFVAFEPWQREMSCAETFRYRWGKRWESEARAARAVPVAIDLLSKSREPKALLDALETPLDELGLVPSPRPLAVAAPTPSSERKSSRGSCGLAASPAGGDLLAAFLVVVMASAVARRRR